MDVAGALQHPLQWFLLMRGDDFLQQALAKQMETGVLGAPEYTFQWFLLMFGDDRCLSWFLLSHPNALIH
jgi:hypothetical protein